MSPLAALTFVLSGVGLGATVVGIQTSLPLTSSLKGHGSSPRRLLFQSCAGLVILVGLFRLFSYLAGWNLDIDRLGFHESARSVNFEEPARMAPTTAFNFLLLGCAMLLAQRRRFTGAFQALALLAGLIGWLGFSRYLYGGPALLPYANMAAHTAATFLILGASILCTRTDGGLMALLISDTAGGVVARRLVPFALVIPIVLGWLRLEGQRMGWYGTEEGVALLALSNIVVFGALIWANAAGLHRSESERKQAGYALRESQELLQSIISNSTTVVYVKDLAGRYLLINRRFEELFHVTQAGILGKTDYDLFPKAQADAFCAVDQKVSLSDKVVEAEEVAPLSDGPHTYLSVKFPLRDAAGKIYATGGISTDITERKRTEEALRESETRYRTLFDTLIEGFCTIEVIFDAEDNPVDYRFLEINPAFEKQTGLKDAQGKLMRDLAPNHEEHWFQIYGRIARTGEPEHFENEAKALGRHYDVCAYRVGGSESRKVAILFNDITERKRAEATLRESAMRFRQIAESLPQLVWTCRPDGYCDFLSQKWVEFTGVPAAEQLGSGWLDQIHTEDRVRLMEAWNATVKTGSRFQVEFRIRGENGSYRWFDTRAEALRGSSGEIVKWFGSNTDITERRESEQKVRAQLTRLSLLHHITRAIGERQDLESIFQVVIRSLEEELPVDFCCICLYDQTSHVLTVNSVGVRSGALALELAMPEKANIPIDENGLSRCVRGQLVHEPDISQAQFPFPERLSRGGLRSLVIAPLQVESKVFGVLVAARLEASSFTSADCEFLRQLSEHVALAAHQAQLSKALQLAYDDLRQTQQAVLQQERLRALGQMASGIAHDINNAISPVALYTESLLETEQHLSTRGRGYLETIGHAIDDVTATVARMREFYRQREPQLSLAPVHLNRLLQQVIDLTRARWSDIPQQRGIVIKLAPQFLPDLPAIMGVESEIREALINLVFNAVDAMPDGGTLTLQTTTTGTNPQRVQVAVIDTGVGMNEDTRRRCLEPFFTTKGERGTGLGLAMVYGIVQRHSADIEIESEVGKGTTIRLSFDVPAVITVERCEPTQRQVVPTRLRILVVDDDPVLLKSLRDILETDGHVVVATNSGQEGLEAFLASQKRNEPFAVVITDLGMPYVDGRKVANVVKNTSPATSVILLTGWGQRLVAEGDIPPHVDHVLNKPPKLRDLREVLSRCQPQPVKQP